MKYQGSLITHCEGQTTCHRTPDFILVPTSKRPITDDYAKAYMDIKNLAERGIPRAQYNLGAIYTSGQGVPQDYAEAVKWYRKAAKQGIARAQFNLGVAYASGQGVLQDYTEAATWFRKAAEQGIAQAQYNLGAMYTSGQGVPQDYAEAVNWYRKAAEQGIAKAQYNLAAMYASGQGVPKQSGLAKLLYTIRQIELLNRDLDGFKDFGAHFQSIDQRLQKAAQDCLVLRDKMNARYLAACEKFEKEVEMPIESWFGQDVSLPGKDAAVSRDQAWSTFACMQNKTTLRILRPYYNEDNFSYIARIMTPPEKKLFEKHVAHFRYYKKAIWRLQFELTGVHPLEVQGVYWPIKLVCQITDDTKALRSKSAIKNLFASTIDSPVGPLNLRFERARKGTINPASLSYTWILPQLHQIARWLTFAKPIRDIQKIITHPEWVGTVVNTRGRAWYDHYMRYLQDLATLPFGTLDQMAGSEIKAPG